MSYLSFEDINVGRSTTKIMTGLMINMRPQKHETHIKAIQYPRLFMIAVFETTKWIVQGFMRRCLCVAIVVQASVFVNHRPQCDSNSSSF